MEGHEGHASTIALSTEECLGLLASLDVGRIAWISGGLPHILPINHRLLHGKVVIRTGSESSLANEVVGAPVAFEVDNVDYGQLSGWSVVVNGICRPVDKDGAHGIPADALTPWVGGSKDLLLTIEPTLITGRRLVDSAQEPKVL